MSLLTFFQQSPLLFSCFVGSFGLLVGSFLNVIIYRVSQNDHTFKLYALISPRSQCPHCKQSILIRDNIPILSFFLLKGRCRHCYNPISLRYPMVELFTSIASLMVAIHFGVNVILIWSLIFTYALIVLSFIDLESFLLPDDITLPMLWLGLFLSLFNIYQGSFDAILGAILGYLSLYTLYWLYKIFTHKEGMGYGDFKLLAMIGAWLGWKTIPFIIFFASFLGVIMGLFLILFKKYYKDVPIPFGPCLSIAGFLGLLGHFDIELFYSILIL